MPTVAELRYEILKYNLERVPDFDILTDEQTEELWNGCGPEWFPKKARKLLTRAFRIFAAAFLIHDFDFARNTEDSFSDMNIRMLRNMYRILDFKYESKCTIRRILWGITAVRIYWKAQAFGRTAWEQAGRKRSGKET